MKRYTIGRAASSNLEANIAALEFRFGEPKVACALRSYGRPKAERNNLCNKLNVPAAFKL